MRLVVDDVEGKARLAAFLHGLQELSWMEGRNVLIETRWATSHAEVRMHAAELAAVAPEVILSGWRRNRGSVGTNDPYRAVPIVFTQVPDPVGAGFVSSLARPGGNVTGFTLFEFGIA
jgi:putative ABC transport system substrate-binding protein